MGIKQHILILIFIFYSVSQFSQTNTIGVLHLTDSVSDGYTLFSPDQSNSVFLINNCGFLINVWTFDERPGNTSYLLENGNLLRAGKRKIEIRDWNNNIVWNINKTSFNLNQHHDIEPLPNGNILLLLKDSYSNTTMINEGRDSLNVATLFSFDRVVEIQPFGTDSAIIVWDWKFFDHLIQDHDSTKLNYGIVVNHPELIDVNYNNGYTGDFTHCNSIDYNKELDQILLSSRHLSELIIIDHSTTTLQASGHTGGNSNMGGDILWRWGNPETYRQGTSLDRKLFLQHDGKWIDSGFVNAGKITVFNNSRDSLTLWSSVNIVTPDFDATSHNYAMSSGIFKPLNFHYSWSDSILGNVFYEFNKSGAQVTDAGNMLICETRKGQITEISPSGNNLWTYKNPVGLMLFNQFDSIFSNTMFRATKYPLWYPGFVGKDLTPDETIENINTLSDSCYLFTGIEELKSEESFIYNPAYEGHIRFTKYLSNTLISISDLSGKKVMLVSNFNGDILKTNLKSGIYVVELVFENENRVTHKIIIQ